MNKHIANLLLNTSIKKVYEVSCGSINCEVLFEYILYGPRDIFYGWSMIGALIKSVDSQKEIIFNCYTQGVSVTFKFE